MWMQAAAWLLFLPNLKVLDVGCGVGQFAELLFDSGVDPTQYQGIDFSKVAIEKAKQRNPDVFLCKNALEFNGDFSRFNAVCFLEVLEHIKEDVALLGMVKTGSTVIISVPNYDSSTHVRYFDSVSQVKKRYESVIKFEDHRLFKQGGSQLIFLLKGVRK